MINTDISDFLRIKVSFFPDVFNLLDPVTVVVLLVTDGIHMSGTRRTSFLTWIISVISSLLIVLFIVVGFVGGVLQFCYPFSLSVKGSCSCCLLVFDMVASIVEEDKQPSRDVPDWINVYDLCVLVLDGIFIIKATKIYRDK
ncbi:Cationic amino acid transporter 8, vacuolar, partial [Cucurbita argyrosperma subsp. argyrosperma]